MKLLTQIFRALLGVGALICALLLAAGRLAWRTIRKGWGSCSKWVRGIAKVLLLLLPVAIVARVVQISYEDAYGRDYWDESLSTRIEIHSYADNTVRLYDRYAERYTTPKLNWVAEAASNDSLAVYALPNRRGFLNVKTGEVVIDALDHAFSAAWAFSEGLAAVVCDGKIGFIDLQGAWAIPCQYDYPRDRPLPEMLFEGGLAVMIDSVGRQGLIDRTGRWVVEPRYSRIARPNDAGYRLVNLEGLYGLIDPRGALCCEAIYDDITFESEACILLARDGLMWQEDCNGNVVRDFVCDYTAYLSYPDDYESVVLTNDDGSTYQSKELTEHLSDYMTFGVCGRVGILCRSTGRVVAPARYDCVNMLSPTLFEARLSEACVWVLLDNEGREVKR